jgi:hypothetical protein
MNIRAIMQAKYPAADFSRYFAHLEQASGDDHDHHIAPRAEFKKLEEEPDNIIPVSYQEHFYAHYLLALAVPDCGPFQQTVVLMVNCFADKIRTDELPFFAEVYERGAQATTECSSRTFKKLHAEPEFAAARDERLKKLNAEPEFAAARDERLKKLHAQPEFAAANAERGREHMKKTNHIRWHVKRGIVSPKCSLCSAALKVSTPPCQVSTPHA